MGVSSGEGTAINSFALVAYLPDPLIGFVDKVRQEIEPGCHLHAHLTFLPPRPVSVSVAQIAQQLAERLRICQPFRVQLGDIHVFPVTQVVHLSIDAGFNEAKHIHETLNRGDLAFVESFHYHPHVTLGQHLTIAEVDPAVELARTRWREYKGDRFFIADHLTLVQNTQEDVWRNLKDFPLGTPVHA